ncbi:MAG: hypothetical protein KC505_03305 [Myxococcales bacterium]|nr:hypothetical protein [Myxococcales bacterium]USN49792.1 MAG: hypothetical protein H6731_05785 [Myxococcales bacterium]
MYKFIPIIFFIVMLNIGCDPVVNAHVPQATQHAVEIKTQGQAIKTKGIFQETCVYGLDKSISDHAPIIYGARATWNICQRVSHRRYQNAQKSYYTHKFRVDDDGALVNKNGDRVLNDALSEENFRDPRWIANQFYATRLKSIAERIKEMFDEHSLSMMALQEIPTFSARDEENKNLRKIFINALKPLQFLSPLQPQAGERAPDVALVVKADSSFKADKVSGPLRLQSYCDDSSKECVISAHMKYPAQDNELKQLCADTEKFVGELINSGFKKIEVLGDFNVDAQKIQSICTDWKIKPTIFTTLEGKSSCIDNQGGLAPHNIDLAMIFEDQ